MLRPPRRGLRILPFLHITPPISTSANKCGLCGTLRLGSLKILEIWWWWEIHYGCAGVRGSLHSGEAHTHHFRRRFHLPPTSQPDDFARTLLGHILAFDRDSVPGVTSHGWITKETEPSGARCPCGYEKPDPHRLRWNVGCSRHNPTICIVSQAP